MARFPKRRRASTKSRIYGRFVYSEDAQPEKKVPNKSSTDRSADETTRTLMEKESARLFNFPRDLVDVLQDIKSVRSALVGPSYLRVQILFQTKPIEDGFSLLRFAVRGKNEKCIRILLDSYDVSRINRLDADVSYPIFMASRYHHLEFLQRWVARGLPLNIHDCEEKTPLYLAATTVMESEENLSTIEFLLDNGADPNAECGRHGVTALDVMLILHSSERKDLTRRATMEFVRSGLDVNREDFLGRTSLFSVKFWPDSNVFFDLLVHGVDVNVEQYHETWEHYSETAFAYVYYLLKDECLHELYPRELLHQELLLYEPMRILVLHVEKLKVLRLPVNPEVTSFIEALTPWLTYMSTRDYKFTDRYVKNCLHQGDFHTFSRQCEAERRKLEETKLDARTSLFHVVFKRTHEMGDLVKDRKFQKYMKSKQYKRDFPIFWHFLEVKYNAGVTRNVILKYARSSLKCVELPLLPEVCLDNILHHFDNFEMMDFIRTVADELEFCLLSDEMNISRILRNCNDFVYAIDF